MLFKKEIQETLMRFVRTTIRLKLPCASALVAIGFLQAISLSAQAPSGTPQAIVKVVGTVTALQGSKLTVESDAGATTTLNTSDSTRVLRAEPGAKSLSEASPAQMSDIAIGDRVLISAAAGDGGSPGNAIRIIAMKQGDIAQRQKAEQADWQRRSTGGLVKSVDPAASTITIAASSRTIEIHTTPTTIFRRYDSSSIKFSDAKPSSLDQIRPGDQLRARGDRNADGGELTAEEVVAGTFRNIAGTVLSVDEAANTVTVTDLATKKPIVIHVSSESQMHKLPQQMAEALAARLKNPNAAAPSGGPGSAGSPGGAAPPTSGQPQGSGLRQGGGPNSAPGAPRGGDLSQMLQRTPTVQVAELHKGDAVMIVATQGTPEAATAVTLLAGVEPILAAPSSASQSMFSASWNLGGGGSSEAAGTP
jgi:Domain of unknown function (DUF5666)